jgi:hypothetical protein
VLESAVDDHVVHHATARHDEAVAALLDAFDVLPHPMVFRRAVTRDHEVDDAPHPAEVGNAVGEGFVARRKDGLGHLVAIAAGRGVRSGDVDHRPTVLRPGSVTFAR